MCAPKGKPNYIGNIITLKLLKMHGPEHLNDIKNHIYLGQGHHLFFSLIFNHYLVLCGLAKKKIYMYIHNKGLFILIVSKFVGPCNTAAKQQIARFTNTEGKNLRFTMFLLFNLHIQQTGRLVCKTQRLHII